MGDREECRIWRKDCLESSRSVLHTRCDLQALLPLLYKKHKSSALLHSCGEGCSVEKQPCSFCEEHWSDVVAICRVRSACQSLRPPTIPSSPTYKEATGCFPSIYKAQGSSFSTASSRCGGTCCSPSPWEMGARNEQFRVGFGHTVRGQSVLHKTLAGRQGGAGQRQRGHLEPSTPIPNCCFCSHFSCASAGTARLAVIGTVAAKFSMCRLEAKCN